MPTVSAIIYDQQGREVTTWTNTEYPEFASTFDLGPDGIARQRQKAPGPKSMPPLDFSDAETEERPSESSADHFIQMEGKGQPQPAAAPRQGASYNPDDPSDIWSDTKSQYDPTDPWWSMDKGGGPEQPEGWHNHPDQGPQRYNIQGGTQAPQSQPYSPPTSSYDLSSYGGMGAANKPTVWGASYGGAGTDPYLKSMQSMAKPFEDFFTQMQFNHF